MGTTKCTTIAVRYRFVLKRRDDAEERDLLYLPHTVVKLEVETPPDESEPELKEEDVVFENDVEYLRSLDPKDWKKQDHYKVLGVKDLRYKATDDIIKTAYRKMVLKHHPDKRKATGEEILADDDYFTCITMAYETLGTPLKKRSYDSVDPEFDDSLPSTGEMKDDFYATFTFYFNLNSRWSERKNVPKLGTAESTREQVERFYSFWYDFKSWREYSYEDEEDKEKCSDRDERRYVDKINKAERLRKKKEEMSRIRQLVDQAYNNDPRIAKFKQDDKDKKTAAKRARQSAVQQRKEEEERNQRALQVEREKAEAEERERIELKKQEREAQKKIVKKERKALRDYCKANNYFAENDGDNLKNLTAVERLCEMLNGVELEDLNKNLKIHGKKTFKAAIMEVDRKIESEKAQSLEKYSQRLTEQVKNTITKVAPEWSYENIQLLIKAVNLFPAGTNQRWDVVATFINQHGSFGQNSTQFTAKMVLAKAKDLQSADFSRSNLKEAANKEAFENFEKDKKNNITVIDSDHQNGVSESASMNSIKIPKEEPSVNKPDTMANGDCKVDTTWTAGEQQLLEQALKTYPASTPERWDRIADCLPNRSKKDCMKRYKELVETIKAKKAAQGNIK